MLQMPLVPSGEIILADVVPVLRDQAAGTAGPLAHAGAEPIGLFWLVLIAIGVFALVYFGLKLRSNAKKR
jgi:hypothetical protein